MNLGIATQQRSMRVGNLAGWAIGLLENPKADTRTSSFLTHADYFAVKIDAALPGTFTGGRFQIVLQAVTDEHYRKLKQTRALDLYLFWQDVNADLLGFLGNLAGIVRGPSADDLAPAHVARIAVTKVARRPGTRAYETQIEGQDWAFHRLSRTPAPQACFDTLASALRSVGDACDVTVTPEPNERQLLGTGIPEEAERTESSRAKSTCADLVRAIGARIAEGLRNDAPGVVLLREGAVHVGRRPIPYPANATIVELDHAGGLGEASPADNATDDDALRQWNLVCRGRPDIKPGSVVSFTRPVEDAPMTAGRAVAAALVGSFASLADGRERPDTTIYVAEVVHRLGRTTGFKTEITGIEMPEMSVRDPWTEVFGGAEDTPRGRAARSPDAASGVVQQMQQLTRAVVDRIRQPEVAEVRSASAKASSSSDPPAQTVTVWEGTEGNPGCANAARSLPMRRKRPTKRRDVATVTPFAWGKCGLVLPRYPGMRVALAFRNGRQDDPLEIGALWGDGERMESKLGDWWLCLPVDAPTTALADDDSDAHVPTGKVVHDLIDAAGTRVIQMGRLTIRAGKNQLEAVGTRPEAADGTITIEHLDGKASITIDADGKITLTGTEITLDAGTTGKVSIKAQSVDVSVQSSMTVR